MNCDPLDKNELQKMFPERCKLKFCFRCKAMKSKSHIKKCKKTFKQPH